MIETAGDLEQARCGPIQGIHGPVNLVKSGMPVMHRTDGCLIAPLQFLTTLFQVEQAQRMGGLPALQHLADDPGQIHHQFRLPIDHREEIRHFSSAHWRADSTLNLRKGDVCHGIHLSSASIGPGGIVICKKLFDPQGRSLCACILNQAQSVPHPKQIDLSHKSNALEENRRRRSELSGVQQNALQYRPKSWKAIKFGIEYSRLGDMCRSDVRPRSVTP
ncbi:hypothetical protein [Accumulibacter sp.]|uniref:hypothetical protein n=1 Tax=Accumulibacter sp. TaxID=2053492 RepID=UPI002581033D|nr:hypothetical protein [Accumulibacter sp.]